MAALVLAAGPITSGLTALGAAGPLLNAVGFFVQQAVMGAAFLFFWGSILGLLPKDQATDPAIQEGGPRLSEFNVTASTEGAPIREAYGRNEMSGQIIWATTFKEVVTQEQVGTAGGGGGKGGALGGGGGGTQPVYATVYRYYVNFAVALCKGPVSRINRMWGDNKPIDESKYVVRKYYGTPAQDPDPLIESYQGAGNVPAFRGVAYVVFENFNITDEFGNHVPNTTFEVVVTTSDDVGHLIQGVDFIPGAIEQGYYPTTVWLDNGQGYRVKDNVFNELGLPDMRVSVEDLTEMCPNLQSVALVAAWFGSDLRLGECTVRPKIEFYDRADQPTWQVNGLGRSQVPLVTQFNNAPAYGSTPSDGSIIAAIQYLKDKGLNVTFYPFLMMDIPHGNTLPDPNNAGSYQPAYPWRGRISSRWAPGQIGNLIRWSEEMDNTAAWTAGSGLSVSANTDNDPYGNPTLDTLTKSSGGSGAKLSQTTTISGATGKRRTLQFIVKKNGSAPNFGLVRVTHNGGSEYIEMAFRLDTGLRSTTVSGVTTHLEGTDDWGDYWRFWVSSVKPSTGTETVEFWAAAGATGSFPTINHSQTGAMKLGNVQMDEGDPSNGIHAYAKSTASPEVPEDQTSAIQDEVDAFFGNAQPGDFTESGTTTIFTGDPDDWGFRRMILHYAHLCKMAGGVDGFLIASEMRGMTTLRSDGTTYPAVNALKGLADDVKGIFTAASQATKVGYAADWSEYWGHNPSDGTGDFFFHLDPLWSASSIDFIGIDNYAPLTDWRDSLHHLDRDELGYTSIYDLNYLMYGIEHGQLYDWYYPTAGATGNDISPERASQTRLPITDGDYGKPWIYRYKDHRNWWLNQHYNRPGGVEDASPTGWVPQSKPIWFTECGCPAVDKGTNQPNVFVDQKSSESFQPFYSTGIRDDFIQRQYIRAIYTYWNPANGNNPTSSVYGGPMIQHDRIHVWTWDARPFPAFPIRTDRWSDAVNWYSNHWISGRMGFMDLKDVVKAICIRGGADPAVIDTSTLVGTVQGYVIDRRMSARAAINQLQSVYRFSAVETVIDGQKTLKFFHRNQEISVTIPLEDLVRSMDQDRQDLYQLTRTQEADLPKVLSLNYIDNLADYKQSVVEARNQTTSSDTEQSINFAIGLNNGYAQGLVDSLMAEIWTAREKLAFILPPRYWALEPGDVINFTIAGANATFRIINVTKEYPVQYEMMRIDAGAFLQFPGPDRPPPINPTPSQSTVLLVLFETPILTDTQNANAPWAAAYATPWPGAAIYVSATGSNYTLNAIVGARTPLGQTKSTLTRGPTDYFDRERTLDIELSYGSLQSLPEIDVLNGGNALALETGTNIWEIIQFQDAEILSGTQWRLSKLLRGRVGSETNMVDTLDPGARVVILDAATLTQLNYTINHIGVTENIKFGPANRPIDDETYDTTTFTAVGTAYKPYAPSHLKATRDTVTDTLTIEWKRRTRFGGEWKDLVDVPLNEDLERYRLRIFKSSVLKRTETVDDAQSFDYTSVLQAADGVDLDTDTIDYTVEQVSATVGVGYPASASWPT